MNENLKEGIIMQHLNWIVPVVGLIGFLFAVVTRAQVIKQDPGTEKMRVIADAIAEGARAFLAAEYRVLVIFVACLLYTSRCV